MKLIKIISLLVLLFAHPLLSNAQLKWVVFWNGNSPIPKSGISAVAIDSHQNLWIPCCGGDSLLKFDRTSWIFFNCPYGCAPTGQNNSDFVIDNLDNIWINTGASIVKFDGTNWAVFTLNFFGIPNDQLTCLSVSKIDNSLWVGTIQNGIIKFDGSNFQFFNTSNSGLTSNSISLISVDHQNNVWALFTFDASIVFFDGINWNNLGLLYDKLGNPTGAKIMYSDQFDHTWFGTDYGGMHRSSGTVISLFSDTTLAGGSFGYVHDAMTIDNQGLPWVGPQIPSPAKACHFNGIYWDQYNHSNSGLPDSIEFFTSMVMDLLNSVWMTTDHSQLIGYNTNGITLSIISDYKKSQENNIYPNPFSNYLVISNERKSILSIKIYDLNGKLISTQGNHLINKKKMIIDTSDFAQGEYFIYAYDKMGNEIISQKLIKAEKFKYSLKVIL